MDDNITRQRGKVPHCCSFLGGEGYAWVLSVHFPDSLMKGTRSLSLDGKLSQLDFGLVGVELIGIDLQPESLFLVAL